MSLKRYIAERNDSVMEHLDDMIERAKKDGRLHTLRFMYDIDDSRKFDLLCEMSEEMFSYTDTRREFETLLDAIYEIAAQWDWQKDDPAVVPTRLTPPLLAVWNAYLCPLDESGFDMDRIDELFEKKTLSKEEDALLDRYLQHRNAILRSRLGDGLFTTERFIGALRLCRLIQLGAPPIIIENEERFFAQGFLLGRHATSCKKIKASEEETV